ncbi:MAG: nuclear transport factor 2 family protein [Steroidobacteraceae bacterium]
MLAGLAGCKTAPPALSLDEARQTVTETELAFARTMANRDLPAFAQYLAPDAVFHSGKEPLRGRDAVVKAWAPFFSAPEAPFSWSPDRVEIAGNGTIAMTTGPVVSSGGTVTGRFNSIWQRQADGTWRIVFDSGSDE